MKNEVSTKLYNINIKSILKSYLNRDFWGKKWVLYEYDGLVLSFKLNTIEIYCNQIRATVSSNRSDSTSYLWFNIDNHSEVLFKKSLFSAMKSVISYEEIDLIRSSHSYNEARRLDTEVAYELEEKASKILDDEKVTNPDIRDAFITKYARENASRYADAYVETSKFAFSPEHYLMLAYLMEKEVPEYSANLIEDVKSKGATSKTRLAKLEKEIQDKLKSYEVEEMED